MPNPYEVMSTANSSRNNTNTDANLALDSLMLDGIPAEDYALKTYTQALATNILAQANNYTADGLASILQIAKAYTDDVVRNQDFSMYATRADLNAAVLQAVQDCTNYINSQITGLHIENYLTIENFESTLQACQQNCARNINTVQQNVNTLSNRVTTNETNNTSAHANLQQQINELFQSGSEAKTKIAAAITAKGQYCTPDETWDSMAAKIGDIITGEGGIDTSDATATPDKILLGYSAYAANRKIYGTYSQPSTIVIGTDTTDATADEWDIAYGKSAYVNGQKLIGRLIIDSSSSDPQDRNLQVEELFGLSGEGYAITQISGNTNPTGVLGISPDGRYIVRLVNIEGTPYLECNVLSGGRIYTWTSNGELLKYRYAFSELNIPEGSTISQIHIGARSTGGYYNVYVAIGKNLYLLGLDGNTNLTQPILEYQGIHTFNKAINTFAVAQKDPTYFAVSFKKDNYNEYQPYIFFEIYQYYEIYNSSLDITEKHVIYVSGYNADYFVGENLIFQANDKCLLASNAIFVLSGNYKIIDSSKFYRLWGGLFISNDGTKLVRVREGARTSDLSTIELYNLNLNLSTGEVTLTLIKSQNYHNSYKVDGSKPFYLTSDAHYLYDSKNGIVQKINWTNSTVELFQEGLTQLSLTKYISTTTDAVYIYNSNTINMAYTNHDPANLIGVKYKGKIFYTLEESQLSANAADVTSGKTFIGVTGSVETGTRGDS